MIRRVLKVLAYAGLALVVIIGLVAGSVVVDALAGRARIDALTNSTLPGVNGNPSVRAHVARPAPAGDTPRPAVIMIHEFWGLQAAIVGKADALAQEGYVVVAPDTYRGAVTGFLPRAIYLASVTSTDQANTDLDTAYAWLRNQPDVDPERIMVMGFCYGGGKALRYSLHNGELAATGVFYGSLISDPGTLRQLPGPVLGIFGAEDQSPAPADVAAFEQGLAAAGIPHEVTIYPGVGHAFVQNMEAIRTDSTQGAAWQQFLDFLDANLRSTRG